MSGNLRQNSKSQGKVREFCCLKFIFSQVEDPNFETFLGECPPRPLNGLGITVEPNLGLEKSGKRQGISYSLEGGNPEYIKFPGTDEVNTNLYKCKLLAKKLGPHQVLVAYCRMI